MTQINLLNELPKDLIELDMTKKENQEFISAIIKDAMKDYPHNVISEIEIHQPPVSKTFDLTEGN